MIISVSRRTDIAAFYMEWFMTRIRERKAIYYNPFNFKGYEVSLQPKDVSVIAFISKNYAPLLPYLDELKNEYNLYFHYTITGLGEVFEEAVPAYEEMLRVFGELSVRTSRSQVEWRFDPIVLTNVTHPEYYRKKFRELASALEGYTERCYISYMTMYDKVKRPLQALDVKRGIKLLEVDIQIQQELANELASIGHEYGIQLYTCCNDLLVNCRVQKGRCIDGEHLSQIFELEKQFPLYPTRDECGCAKCIDIGVYDTCPHGCIYCYANWKKGVAVHNYREHNSQDELLLKGKIEVVKHLDDPGCEQISLF